MKNFFEKIATKSSKFAGSTCAFVGSFLLIIIWLICGPLFHFSNTWQLVINTSTTIITFLMVFLIQRSQNKDSEAIHLKLNELIASIKGPSNRLIDIEDLSEEELKILHKFYAHLSKSAKKESDLSCSHSIEEARIFHKTKYKMKQ